MKTHSRLQRIALKLFGDWDSALRAAGIAPERVRRRRRWDAQVVVRHIRELTKQGKPLNSAAVQRLDPMLVEAASRYCTSWEAALRLAGLDPRQHRQRRPDWTRNKVIRAILEIESAGGKLNRAALANDSINQAAARLFGSWDSALEAAGLDPSKVRRRTEWTPGNVLKSIRGKGRAGAPLAYSKVMPRSITAAAKRFFGSWDAALRTAGLDPARIRLSKPRCKPWTRATILAAIRRKHRRRKPLHAHGVRPFSLYCAGRRLFGSWTDALQAAGLEPMAIRGDRSRT